MTKWWDVTDFAHYLYAPFSWPESTPIYRIISQTIWSAILANQADELDLNAVNAAWTTFLSRILSEARRRGMALWAITKWVTTTVVDPNVKRYESLPQIFKAWKEWTSWYWYFIDRDINYYWYEADMPYTPHSEIALFIPEWNKWKMEFMKMNTIKQIWELQKTDKTARDYFKYRIPIWKSFETGKFGDSTWYEWLLWKVFWSTDLSVDHYVTNTPKRWNELQKWNLNLNWDLEAWEYVFNLLTQHAIQPFNDAKQSEWTKKFLNNMAKEYNFITDDWEVVNLAWLSNKEALWVKNMFKLADEWRMATFFTEFTKADNNDQKQWLLLMAYIDAQTTTEWNVPWVSRSLTSALAQDMYYYLSNKVKKEKWIPFEPWKFLSDYDPKADREIKYFIADQLWESLYYNDKNSRTTLGRYYARDRAIKEWSPVENLFSKKYVEWEDWNINLKYWDVKVVRSLKEKDWDDRTNTLANNLNSLYMLTNILVAEWKANPDKFYVGMSSILTPKSWKMTNDPASVNLIMWMAKVIAERIDDSILPSQEKTAAKAWLLAGMLPMLNEVRLDVIRVIWEEKYRQFQDWIYWVFKELWEQEIYLSYKLAQDWQYKWTPEETWTVIDMYNSNGNYKNTYWSNDYADIYAKSSKYYKPISTYYRNNYNNIPKTYVKVNPTYWKESNYKNLYLKLLNAKTESISWWIWKWDAPSTWFKLKWSWQIKLSKPAPKADTGWLISSWKDAWLIKWTRTRRSTKYPDIVPTYREE